MGYEPHSAFFAFLFAPFTHSSLHADPHYFYSSLHFFSNSVMDFHELQLVIILVTTDQKDGSGACSIHLAVTCDGMDEDFERTVSALERIRYEQSDSNIEIA